MGITHLVVNAVKSYQAQVPGLRPKGAQISSIASKTRRFNKVLTVSSLVSSLHPMPLKSILLGRCTDGLPFLMALSDSQIGAILVGGDAGCGKTHQLQVMVDSAILINAPRDLQISIVTHHPDDWKRLQADSRQNKYLQAVHAWYDFRAEANIKRLTTLAENRREGQQSEPAVLLILDDLHFAEDLSYEAQVNLRWLLEYGSQSNIWVVATIKAELAAGLRYWLEPFRTRIIGRVQSPSGAAAITQAPDSQANDLESSAFRVWTGDHWLTYRIPLLGDCA